MERIAASSSSASYCLPLLLVASFCLCCIVQVRAQSHCYSCASPILQSEWQATGFPTRPPIIFAGPRKNEAGDPKEPKQFAFVPQCEEKSTGTSVMPKSDCSNGVCLEMVLVTNGVYAIVRGCVEDFYPPSYQVPYGEMGCFYTTINRNVTVYDGAKVESIKSAAVGFNLCQNAKADTPCNNELQISLNIAKGVQTTDGTGWLTTTSSTGALPCKKATGGVDCLECSRVDMEGYCDWGVREYCSGIWCTKTLGYVNGRYLEIRGCSSINPLNTQRCTKIEMNAEIAQLGVTQIPEHISLEQCFCNGQKCNGANTVNMMMGVKWVALMIAMAAILSFFMSL